MRENGRRVFMCYIGVMRIYILIIALFMMVIVPAYADDGVRVQAVAKNLDHPWSVTFLPKNKAGDVDFLVTERSGNLLHITADGKTRTAFKNVPRVVDRGQGGLLDVILDPAFDINQRIYLSYAGAGNGGAGTEIARARLDLQNHRLLEVSVLFRAMPKSGSAQHFGRRMAFLPDGTLLLSLGDRGDMDEAQNKGNHLGAIIRVDVDGGVPDDNPFVKQDAVRPEIYSFGHRNVQGLAIQPGTGVVFAHEHGPRGGDEVNLIKPGRNYGWPEITYGIDYTGFKITDATAAPGMEQPLIHWTPSIAPSGMAFYTGDLFPQWRGHILVGALAGASLRVLQVDGDRIGQQHTLLTDLDERIRDVRVGPDGAVYILTDSSDGQLLRLTPQ